MTELEFQNLVKSGIVLLDGAMGSNLMLKGMPKGVCTEKWVCEHQDVQKEIQSAYVEAGSQIIYAPTFQANRISLANHGLENCIGELNKIPVLNAKEAAAGKALVAGDITSTGRYTENYDVLLDVYKEQIALLAETGVDLLAIETMIGMDETMAAIDAAKNVCDLPIICTMTVEADGSLLLGGNIYEAVATYEAMGASAVGINCSLGPDQLVAIVQGMKNAVSIPVVVKPNAGMPFINEQGQAEYTMGPEEYAKHMKVLVEAGADLIGGCCGTNPDYISELKKQCEK